MDEDTETQGSFSQQSFEAGPVVLPALWMRTLRHRGHLVVLVPLEGGTQEALEEESQGDLKEDQERTFFL